MRNTKTNAFRRTAAQPLSEENDRSRVDADKLLPKAKDDRVVVGFRIEEGKKRAFKEKTAREGTSIQEVLNAAVDAYIHDS